MFIAVFNSRPEPISSVDKPYCWDSRLIHRRKFQVDYPQALTHPFFSV